MNAGADPNILDKDKISAIGLAIRDNKDDVAMKLLEY